MESGNIFQVTVRCYVAAEADTHSLPPNSQEVVEKIVHRSAIMPTTHNSDNVMI